MKITKTWWVIFAAIVVGLFFYSIREANAQTVCMPRAKLLEQAKRVYNEEPSSRGFLVFPNGQKHMLEIWAAPDGKTFTMVTTKSDGTSCVWNIGVAWEGLIKKDG